jgi:hypothetical protein
LLDIDGQAESNNESNSIAKPPGDEVECIRLRGECAVEWEHLITTMRSATENLMSFNQRFLWSDPSNLSVGEATLRLSSQAQAPDRVRYMASFRSYVNRIFPYDLELEPVHSNEMLMWQVSSLENGRKFLTRELGLRLISELESYHSHIQISYV